MKRKLVLFMLFCFALSSLAQELSQGKEMTIKQDTLHAPIATYKQALYIIENSKEYKKFKKEQHLKKEKYVVSSDIKDFQIWAFNLKHNSGVHYELVSYYDKGYTDDAMQQLSQVEEGRILIYFSNIDNDFFWVSIYPARQKVRNPRAKNTPGFCRMLLFLFRSENSNAKYVSVRIMQLD